MDIKEKIHELSEEMIQNLGRLVAVDSQLGITAVVVQINRLKAELISNF